MSSPLLCAPHVAAAVHTGVNRCILCMWVIRQNISMKSDLDRDKAYDVSVLHVKHIYFTTERLFSTHSQDSVCIALVSFDAFFQKILFVLLFSFKRLAKCIV